MIVTLAILIAALAVVFAISQNLIYKKVRKYIRHTTLPKGTKGRLAFTYFVATTFGVVIAIIVTSIF